MTSLSYRYLRRQLSGAIPSSRLGRFALYVAVLDLLFFVLQRVLYLFAATASTGAALGGWINFLSVVLGIAGSLLLLRWVRRHLLWRLRNRLLVTYVFVGVIPVALLVLMGLLATYILGGQFASYLAISDLHSEINSLSAVNSGITAELAQELRGGRSLESAAPRRRGQVRRFPTRQVTAWYRGQARVLAVPPDSTAQPTPPPAWLTEDFKGLVLEDHSLFLRAASLADVDGERLIVISTEPLDSELLNRLTAGLWRVQFYLRNFKVSTEQGVLLESDEPSAERPEAKVNGGPGARAAAEASPTVVSGGTVPTARGRFDGNFTFYSAVPVTGWHDKQNLAVPVSVQARPSAIYRRLSSTVGFWVGAYFVALAITAVLFALIELLALFIGLGLTRTITRSVANLYEATERINRGDFRYRIQVRSRDQLAALETSFNSMSASLEKLLVEQREKERLQSELAIAQEVQGQLFPKSNLHLDSLELYGVCRPARTVSGDYYDFLPLGGEKMGIAVGDISGKGISAALVMATLHSAVRVYEFGGLPDRAQISSAGLAVLTALRRGEGHPVPALSSNGIHSPSEVLWLLNRHLFHNTPEEKYATLFLGVFDGRSRRITYSNAGHLPPVVLGEDGSERRLVAGGMPIGLFDNLAFEEGGTELNPGDIFVAYSDGVTEPENEFGEFGEHRLLELVREHRHGPLERVAEVVLAAVADWIGSAEQPDDVTLVLARLR
jgi:sigma-B regulation protein RsbU (phosphoserine phosphatase)